MKTAIYFIPLQVAHIIYAHGNLHDLILAFMPISNGPYWFISTYLCLFMLSSFINEYLAKISTERRKQLLIVLSIMSLYLGFMGPVEGPLALGKNVIHFILLYVIGNTIRNHKGVFNKFSTDTLILSFSLIGILPVFLFCMVAKTKITYLMCMFDWDNGIFLLLSAVTLFLIFSRIHFQSKSINYLATSVSAVYILQQQPVISSFLGEFFHDMWPYQIIPSENSLISTLPLVAFVVFRSICYMIIFIMADKLLNPVWVLVSRFSSYLDGRVKSRIKLG